MMKNPSVLLLICGVLVGLSFPLAKLAEAAGIPIFSWAILHTLGAVLVLLPALLFKGKLGLPSSKSLRYAAIAGPMTLAAPNVLVFWIVPHTGAGFTGLMFALSPVFTLGLAVLFRMKTTSRFGLVGIGLGLMGAVLVSISRNMSLNNSSIFWMAAAVLIPVWLAGGNIYRTKDWPPGVSADVLALWSNSFALLIYFVLVTLVQTDWGWLALAGSKWLVLSQLAVAGLIAPVMFRLQQYGGPVVLSQVGYVAAATGLAVSTAFLNESYSPGTWLGALVIAIGIGTTIYAGKICSQPLGVQKQMCQG